MSSPAGGSARPSSFTLIPGLPHNSPTIGQMTLIFIKALQAQNMPEIHSHSIISARRMRVHLSSLATPAALAQMQPTSPLDDQPSCHAHLMHPTSTMHARSAASSRLPPLSERPPPLETSTSTIFGRLNQLFRRDQVFTRSFSSRGGNPASSERSTNPPPYGTCSPPPSYVNSLGHAVPGSSWR